jgi:hypothetical protein
VQVSSKTRLFIILWLGGIVGVLSFALVDLSALIKTLPQPAGAAPVELPPPALLKVVSLIQPAVLVTLAVFVGTWLAERVGLRSPAAEAAARGEGVIEKLKPQIVPGIVAGLLSGVGIVLAWVIAKPFLTADFISRAEEFNNFIPAAVRMLYGGVAEEILLRWGVMTFLVWASSRLFGRTASSEQDSTSSPRPVIYIAAIVLSALAFGAGHLPIAYVLSGGLTLPIVIYVIIANSLFGIVAGFLYWKRGLEAAMIAHMCAHLVLITAIALSF